ncbi:MAG TPA: hypothetical protein PK228_03850, partial [Saprospiraceae bacterium]|nr:hypothetical protein [Saprospiraceae bacterium]
HRLPQQLAADPAVKIRGRHKGQKTGVLYQRPNWRRIVGGNTVLFDINHGLLVYWQAFVDCFGIVSFAIGLVCTVLHGYVEAVAGGEESKDVQGS